MAIAIWGELGEEPGGIAVGGEELHDGLEVQSLVLAVDGVALRAAVLEEFLALSCTDECHVFDSCVSGTGAVRSPPTRTAPGRAASNAGHRSRSCRD